jgi:hypothetical protein
MAEKNRRNCLQDGLLFKRSYEKILHRKRKNGRHTKNKFNFRFAISLLALKMQKSDEAEFLSLSAALHKQKASF